MNPITIASMLITLAALLTPLAATSAGTVALDPEENEFTEDRSRYSGAAVPVEALQHVVTPGAPDMTDEEFSQAQKLYFERCSGCHGVLRRGANGKSLKPELTQQRGTEFLRNMIEHGTSRGMPSWGSSGNLTDAEITLLAGYLQHRPPEPPEWGMREMLNNWRLLVPIENRPAKPRHNYDIDNIFAVIQRDGDNLILIDGGSKKIIATIETGYGVLSASVSGSGRYLYTIGRDARVSLIDLYMSPPAAVATLRVGLEARAVEASKFKGYEDQVAIAGAYWPPHFVLMDGATLEPQKIVSTRGMTVDTQEYHPEPRVASVAASHQHPEFIVSVKETGHILLVDYSNPDALSTVALNATRLLNQGGWDSTQRYFLVAASQTNKIAVVDSQQRKILAMVDAPRFPNPDHGANILDPDNGPVWVTSSLGNENISFIGTDPENHPEQAWKLVRVLHGPGAGSMSVKSHPASRNLWVDAPLSPNAEVNQSIAVYDIDNLEAGYKSLPIARWADIGEGPARVLQPEFNARGDEVWFSVANGKGQQSAIVVVDDRTRTLKTVIKDPRLITPMNKFNIRNTMNDIY